ncbi:hypothetical protein LCGC14_2309400 [marine sediment metagenome]|uniref:Calcineurin-like phosphoesterase domain-containing protein n=1 Tax=marine sediment metagenome TaxID=412755 RepID=A0A0F9CL38_9ZZZZ
MRIAIISDVHANLAALEAMLRHAEAQGATDGLWCLGDTVGYGPQPSECISRLRDAGAKLVAGNHDRAATGKIGTEEFNPDAAKAALWTRNQIAEDVAAYLDGLPEVTHATPGKAPAFRHRKPSSPSCTAACAGPSGSTSTPTRQLRPTWSGSRHPSA